MGNPYRYIFSIICLYYIVEQDAGVHCLDSVLVGFHYRNYTNFDGTLASGECCDEPTETAPSCSSDMCDVVLTVCGARDFSISDPCDIYPSTALDVFNDTNSIKFENTIKQGDKSRFNFLPVRVPYSKKPTLYWISAQEITTGTSKQLIANFTFTVDWVDPIFSSKNPKYRTFHLEDNNNELYIDFLSMCVKYYYTEDCSVYCKPDIIHYTCLDNGTKACRPGWTGPDCMTMIDYCVLGHRCQYNSTCFPVLRNYSCICLPDYTGFYCEVSLRTTTTSSTESTTTTLTTTTAKLAASSQSASPEPTTLDLISTSTKSGSSKPVTRSTLDAKTSPKPVSTPENPSMSMATTLSKRILMSPSPVPASSSSLDKTVIIGAGVGAGLLALLLTLLLCYLCCRDKDKKKRKVTPTNTNITYVKSKEAISATVNTNDQAGMNWGNNGPNGKNAFHRSPPVATMFGREPSW